MSASSKRTTSHRNASLAKIHIAKAQLGLDEETYRGMLWTMARVHSSKDLTTDGRQRVLEHLRARGFKDARPRKRFPGRPHNTDSNAQLKKVEALLASAGRVWAYADGMAARMFQVDRVAFCDPQQLQKLIAALVIDAKRRSEKLDEANRP